MNWETGKDGVTSWNERGWNVAQGEGLFMHVDVRGGGERWAARSLCLGWYSLTCPLNRSPDAVPSLFLAPAQPTKW
jgi:hypothetical protein